MQFIFKILGGFFLLFIIIVSYFYFLGTVDIRTETAKNELNEKKARVLLEEMANAHQISNWAGLETYSVLFEDQFYGEMGDMGNPFKEDSVRFLLTYIPNTFDGMLQFLSGERFGYLWGLQSWKSYIIHPSRGLKFKNSNDITFWLPTYQYFLEFPFRIQKANALTYAGEQTIDGIDCEGIIASWNTTAPQRDIDQYLVWLDKETKRIVKLEYTIREAYNFLRGAAYFQEYKNFDGIILPTKMPVESNLVEEGFLHEMRIFEFEKNPLSQKDLRPNRALAEMGDEKDGE